MKRGGGFKVEPNPGSTLKRGGFRLPVFVPVQMAAPTPVQGGVWTPTSDVVIALPKQNAIESEPFRRLVAAMPCIYCNLADHSQAAHPPPTGKGIKEDDRECFPLCCCRPLVPGCHFRFDQYQIFPSEVIREVAADWGKRVRSEILQAGAWPAGLPLFDS